MIYPQIPEMCVICRESFFDKNTNFLDVTKDKVETLCRHLFHKKCLNEWFKKDISCPVCRRGKQRLQNGEMENFLTDENRNEMIKARQELYQEHEEQENNRLQGRIFLFGLERIINRNFTRVLNFNDAERKQRIRNFLANTAQVLCKAVDDQIADNQYVERIKNSFFYIARGSGYINMPENDEILDEINAAFPLLFLSL